MEYGAAESPIDLRYPLGLTLNSPGEQWTGQVLNLRQSERKGGTNLPVLFLLSYPPAC